VGAPAAVVVSPGVTCVCVVRIAKVLETARPSQSYSRSCQCKFSPRCTQRKIDVSNFQCNTLSKKKIKQVVLPAA
jgi:hypothetical protein